MAQKFSDLLVPETVHVSEQQRSVTMTRQRLQEGRNKDGSRLADRR
ncbi:hypothetical protein R69927_05971 [Paraburkholderia domus]|nr:hypothetical protein [Paraburkholderia domus]MBK5089925.1 hypothetical protein [Burkholderia sp. R-69927]CAE6910606.1 hypothetical protein R69927_05971 [Paraburkholderia domus]